MRKRSGARKKKERESRRKERRRNCTDRKDVERVEQKGE